jgi:hypothetical protein
MIVYYYCVTAKHIQRCHARTTEIFVMTSTAMRIASLVTAINVLVAGGIFDRGTCQPEVGIAGGLRSDGRLIHICNVCRGP